MNKRGFTLIELLVAASLFLAGVVAINYILKSSADSVASAEKLNTAVYTIQAKMEEIRQLPFDQLLQQNGQTFAQGQGKIFAYFVITDLAKMQLQLDWHPQKAPIKLYTLRSRHQ